MNTEIKFQKKNPQNCDFETKRGEIALMQGYAFEGGCMRPIEMPFGENTDHNAIRQLFSGQNIRDIAKCGNCYAVSTDDGMHFCVQRDGSYIALWLEDLRIELQFGLQKAGCLRFPNKFSVPTTLTTSYTSSGGVPVHPSAVYDKQTSQSAHSIIIKALDEALLTQAESLGYFHSPFFVRYAIKLINGMYGYCSAPILMIPSCLPPRLEINSLSADHNIDGMSVISLSSSTVPYYKLRVKTTSTISEEWLPLVESIDIFISPQIPTYSKSTDNPLGITTYSNVIDNSPSYNSPSSIFQGNWADDDNFTDHILSSLQLNSKVWGLRPYPHIYADICKMSDFHLIASYKNSSYPSSNFCDANIKDTSKSSIKAKPKLKENPYSLRTAIPQSMICDSDRIFMGGGTRKNSAPELTDTFPRYIYHPNPKTTKIHFERNGQNWILPLTKHDTLPGCYMFAGFSAWPSNEYASDEQYQCVSDTYSEANIARLIPLNDATHQESQITLNEKINSIAISQDKKELYIFTDNGIWQTKIKASQLQSPVQISNEICKSNRGVCPTPHGIFFANKNGLYRISNSNIALMLSPYQLLDTQTIYRLPNIDKFIDTNAYNSIDANLYFKDCTLSYLREINAIKITDKSHRIQFLYLISTGAVTTINEDDDDCVAITRPIEINRKIKNINIKYSYPCENTKSIVYGSDDLRHWLQLTTIVGDGACGLYTKKWKFIIIAIMSKNATLHGISIN